MYHARPEQRYGFVPIEKVRTLPVSGSTLIHRLLTSRAQTTERRLVLLPEGQEPCRKIAPVEESGTAFCRTSRARSLRYCNHILCPLIFPFSHSWRRATNGSTRSTFWSVALPRWSPTDWASERSRLALLGGKG